MCARTVPGTCPFCLHFRTQLSPGWMGLRLHLHSSLGFQLGPGRVKSTPGTCRALHCWTCTPGCWGKREAAEKTQTNTEAGSEGKEKTWMKQSRRTGEIKTKELVTGYLRPVFHFANASLHAQSTETRLQLCPFPDIPQPNLFKAESLCTISEKNEWVSSITALL